MTGSQMESCATQTAALPRVLFVDDEQRVLNSMRIMFRRRFDLHFASDGHSALDIIREHDIDVVVADHRMPEMTGVEVLTAVRAFSPRTVRILLTGYADLDAIEGSINEGEVFRFLTKPCAPAQLRATLDLAVEVAEKSHAGLAANVAETSPTSPGDTEAAADSHPESAQEAPTAEPPAPASEAVPQPSAHLTRTITEHELAETDVIDQAELAAVMPDSRQHVEPPKIEAVSSSGVLVFSVDENIIACIQQASGARFPVHVASNIVQVVKILKEHRPGVLVTDITHDRSTIQVMTGRLKQHLPELVTIIVSEHRDALDMIWLINHGQIFRFLHKPVSPGRCAVSIQAALQHHEALRINPLLADRHAVDRADDSGVLSGVFDTLKSVRRLWA